jgi:hypothetical protein
LDRNITSATAFLSAEVMNHCAAVKGGDTSKLDGLVKTLRDLPMEGDPCFDCVVCASIVMNVGLDVLVEHEMVGQLGDEKVVRVRELAHAVKEALGGSPGAGDLLDLQA